MKRMHPARRVKIFSDRYPFVGPALWALSIQFFIIQFIVADAWPKIPYSWLQNTISDLGNTVCGPYGNRLVCSPNHTLMNVSFIVLGLTMIPGAALIYQEFRKNAGTLVGFTAMALSGIGTIMVGLFPENTIGILHFSGALLPFLVGNLGILILGLSLDAPDWFKTYSVLTGIITLIGLALFITQHYLGLGIGGMERIAAHPQTVWLIVFGIYTSRNRYRAQRQ